MEVRRKVPSRYTVRTSDRRVFRRCLRKWGLSSSLKGNWTKQGSEQNINFWFGSAIHFAMEDYHGWNFFGDPRNAFYAYVNAFTPAERPGEAVAVYDLGISMLSYYLDWYPRHNAELQLETLWFNDALEEAEPYSEGAHPAVEQKFWLSLDISVIVDAKTGDIIGEYTENSGVELYNEEDPVAFRLDEPEEMPGAIVGYVPINGTSRKVFIVPIHYHGTIDRMVKDRYGRRWILDYKTAKGADTEKLDTDDQISAYLWAVWRMFKKEFYGFIYLQLTKDMIRPPKKLKNGEFSIDKKQKTTRIVARKALVDYYGDIKKVPSKYIDWLNALASQETPEGDRFIRWDFVRRSTKQLEATYNHILGETRMMISPYLYLYPNPTRDCSWDCPWRDACLALDDGRVIEVEMSLQRDYVQRGREEDGDQGESWRKKVQWPDRGSAEIMKGIVSPNWKDGAWAESTDIMGYTVDDSVEFDELFKFDNMEASDE